MAAQATDLIQDQGVALAAPDPSVFSVRALLFDDRYAMDGMLIGVGLLLVGLIVWGLVGVPPAVR